MCRRGTEDKYIAANNILADRISALEKMPSAQYVFDTDQRLGKLEEKFSAVINFFRGFTTRERRAKNKLHPKKLHELRLINED